VIAANCGGPAEIIDPGVTGLLFSANEVDELASALVLLRSDPDLRQRLGQAGKQRSMDFAPEIAARPVAQVDRDCLSYEVVSRL
jgi:glycosyltransferase involved in cell wall biosynthesis